MNEEPRPSWYADPTGRHQFRYWDGSAWTNNAADDGIQLIDPLSSPATPSGQLTRKEVRQAQKGMRAEQARVEQAKTEREKQERVAREREAQMQAQREAQAREAERLQQLARDREVAEQALRQAHEREARMFRLPLFFLPAYNSYPSTEVAGEFAYINAIHTVLGRAPKRDEEIIDESATAILAPEPLNEFDRNAVRVVVNGQLLGYLEREVAAVVQPTLVRIVDAGHLPAVGARIWAVARPDYSDARKLRHHANVRVALNYVNMLLPINDPPHEEYSVLPWASGLQVTGEEQHPDVLSNYISLDGEALVIGELAVIQSTRAHAKDLVEVRIDGERIGQLTPGTSQHFLPTIWHLHAQGMTTAVWLLVKGNAIAAQVTIHATRAHQLPGDWFERPHTVPRLHGRTSAKAESALDDAEIRTAMRQPMWDE